MPGRPARLLGAGTDLPSRRGGCEATERAGSVSAPTRRATSGSPRTRLTAHAAPIPLGGPGRAGTHKDSRCLSCCSCCASCRRRFCSRRRCSSCSGGSLSRRSPLAPVSARLGRDDIAARAAQAAAKTTLPPCRARRTPPPRSPPSRPPRPGLKSLLRTPGSCRLACWCRSLERAPWRPRRAEDALDGTLTSLPSLWSSSPSGHLPSIPGGQGLIIFKMN